MNKMQSGTTQTTKAIPANLTAILQAYGLPMPTELNENAEPVWLINNQKISWAQMQTIIWQRQMAMAEKKGGSGTLGGPEQLSMSVVADANLDGVPDVHFEQKVESSIEQQQQSIDTTLEHLDEQKSESDTPHTQPSPTQNKQDSYLGDSPALSQVDTGDTGSMSSYVAQHTKAPEDTSRRFLAETLKKILLMISLKI